MAPTQAFLLPWLPVMTSSMHSTNRASLVEFCLCRVSHEPSLFVCFLSPIYKPVKDGERRFIYSRVHLFILPDILSHRTFICMPESPFQFIGRKRWGGGTGSPLFSLNLGVARRTFTLCRWCYKQMVTCKSKGSWGVESVWPKNQFVVVWWKMGRVQ